MKRLFLVSMIAARLATTFRTGYIRLLGPAGVTNAPVPCLPSTVSTSQYAASTILSGISQSTCRTYYLNPPHLFDRAVECMHIRRQSAPCFALAQMD